MPSGEDIRDAQRTVWSGLAPSWERWDPIITAQLAPVGAAMVDALGVAPDQHHLDVASGTGEPGLSLAGLAPAGRVVLTDLVARMLEVADRRARQLGIGNVELAVCSADGLPFGEGTFDSVTARFGFMFFPDVGQATAELVRVLRPGGRLCTSVWVRPEANPWTTLAMEAIATEVTLPPPDPDGPSMYRFASDGRISAVFEEAGLVEVTEWDVEIELVTGSPEEYWEMISDHVSLVAAALRQVDGPARQRIREHALAAVSGFRRDGAVRVPGLARCIVGTKVAAPTGPGRPGSGGAHR